jgi:hypothetical protein
MKSLGVWFFIFGLTVNALAAEGGKVIELGDVEVVGELRRPNLFVVDSPKALDPLLQRQARKEWKDLEDALTRLDEGRGSNHPVFEETQP